MLLRESSTRHAHPRWAPPLADTDAAIVPVSAGAPRARLQNGTDTLASMPNHKTLNGFVFSALLTEGSAELYELGEGVASLFWS
jgi:hypothetical protein